MKLSDFDYHLPQDLIAQHPPAQRDAARMLVLHRESRTWEDRSFRDLPSYLQAGDCLVLNESKVLPARLLAGNREILLLEPVSSDAREWRALGRRVRTGDVIHFDEGFAAEIVAAGERGEHRVRFIGGDDVYGSIDRLGHMPLPPYIKRPDHVEDRERYQSVFARAPGSVAAPTAGLHFTGETLDRVQNAGARIARVTLHVGLGTFQPIDREDFENHQLHYERYASTGETLREIQAARRVIAVGTTSVRTIESAVQSGHREGVTNLFIYPGYRFRRVDAMLTNFHLPRSSLLLLVCALAETGFVLDAYRHAVEHGYRFFSYGDCMLIL